MALALAYVNEVLNHLDSTVVVDEATWPSLVTALKFEGRDLTQLVLGRMKLRWCPGGWEGLLARLDQVEKERDDLKAEVAALKALPPVEMTPQPAVADAPALP